MRAMRVDGNHREIVEALQKIGAFVTYLKEPVDLLVSYQGAWIVMEVKPVKASSKARLTWTSNEFEWMVVQNAKVYLVRTPAEACHAAVEEAEIYMSGLSCQRQWREGQP